jgi:hypothetical protein
VYTSLLPCRSYNRRERINFIIIDEFARRCPRVRSSSPHHHHHGDYRALEEKNKFIILFVYLLRLRSSFVSLLTFRTRLNSKHFQLSDAMHAMACCLKFMFSLVGARILCVCMYTCMRLSKSPARVMTHIGSREKKKKITSDKH